MGSPSLESSLDLAGLFSPWGRQSLLSQSQIWLGRINVSIALSRADSSQEFKFIGHKSIFIGKGRLYKLCYTF